MIKKIKILYVAGMGRSGSTLLTNLLHQIEGFSNIGELYYIWERGFQENRLCGCGVPFALCQFWEGIIQHAQQGLPDFDPQEMAQLTHKLARSRHLPLMMTGIGRQWLDMQSLIYRTWLAQLYQAIQNVNQSRVLVDASKFPSYAFHLSRMPSIELYLLHLVRDPRAVAYSWQRKRINPDSQRPMGRMSIAKSALMWRMWNQSIESISQTLPDPQHYMRLRYEDFVDHPELNFQQLCAFLNEPLALHEITNALAQQPQENHAIAGNPARFQQDGFKIKSDNTWQTEMSTIQKFQVKCLTGSLQSKYNYDKINVL